MIRPIQRKSGKTHPLILDERREWLRERYDIRPIIMSRSEGVKVIIDGKECSAATIIAMAAEHMKGDGHGEENENMR
ncbi:hypothetical protein ACM1RC_30370 [Paenibacillus azoreducens]|uniref:hypothetical protein n=1 Tax=Paenibacillus azoreducens TaxID=116718 RepID=UPI0039F4A14C